MVNLLRTAILIISDTASAAPESDKAGPLLAKTFQDVGNEAWDVEKPCIVPDNVSRIQDAIQAWCDDAQYFNLIVTSGGTGFAQKDTTPEAIGPLIDRHAPGLVHAMLAASMQITPFAMMSRPVAGVRKNTLIVTLPGSPKGATENLQSILKLLPHACLQAAGGDSRSLHSGGVKKLEEEAGVTSKPSGDLHRRHDHSHSHSHQHGSHNVPRAHTTPADRLVSNDPQAGPTRRYRESPYPMLPVELATEIILKHTPSPNPFSAAVDISLVGSVLAEDVTASEAVPAFRASIVDGYAIIVTKPKKSKGVFAVSSVSHAAPGQVEALQAGRVARITTGAPLPPDATSVVMVEDTVLRSMTADGLEENEIEIFTNDIEPNENVREVGSDVRVGETVLNKGDIITAVGGELGLLASVGRAEVMIYKKPIVGVLSTGDEIIPHNRAGPLRLGEVRDSNRPTIMAAVKSWGYEVVDLGIASDTPGALETTLRSALRTVDVIITTGGVSMGELDLLKPTIERSLGGTIHFGRVAMKPGKPTTFATIPFKNNAGDDDTRLIFSLPGNPASAVVTLHLFVLPSLQAASGEKERGLPKVVVVLDEDVRCDETRSEYQRAIVIAGKDGLLHAVTTGGQRSSRIGSLKAANSLLCLPAGGGVVKAGGRMEALLMGQIGSGGD
ncbi:hypothetical protein MMC32_000357 [Xylographa parallela]|nr:hypothetical protein [Xylographa parallela]